MQTAQSSINTTGCASTSMFGQYLLLYPEDLLQLFFFRLHSDWQQSCIHKIKNCKMQPLTVLVQGFGKRRWGCTWFSFHHNTQLWSIKYVQSHESWWITLWCECRNSTIRLPIFKIEYKIIAVVITFHSYTFLVSLTTMQYYKVLKLVSLLIKLHFQDCVTCRNL